MGADGVEEVNLGCGVEQTVAELGHVDHRRGVKMSARRIG